MESTGMASPSRSTSSQQQHQQEHRQSPAIPNTPGARNKGPPRPIAIPLPIIGARGYSPSHSRPGSPSKQQLSSSFKSRIPVPSPKSRPTTPVTPAYQSSSKGRSVPPSPSGRQPRTIAMTSSGNTLQNGSNGSGLGVNSTVTSGAGRKVRGGITQAPSHSPSSSNVGLKSTTVPRAKVGALASGASVNGSAVGGGSGGSGGPFVARATVTATTSAPSSRSRSPGRAKATLPPSSLNIAASSVPNAPIPLTSPPGQSSSFSSLGLQSAPTTRPNSTHPAPSEPSTTSRARSGIGVTSPSSSASQPRRRVSAGSSLISGSSSSVSAHTTPPPPTSYAFNHPNQALLDPINIPASTTTRQPPSVPSQSVPKPFTTSPTTIRAPLSISRPGPNPVNQISSTGVTIVDGGSSSSNSIRTIGHTRSQSAISMSSLNQGYGQPGPSSNQSNPSWADRQRHRSDSMSSNSLSNLSSPSAGGPSGGASSVGQRKDTRRTPIPGAGEDDYDDDDDDLAELREREREARENRKILDLEISNASLLAINVTLEKTKLKQSSEIRDLKRRLRDRSYAPPLSSPSLLASLDASSQYSDQQPFQANNPLSDDEDGEPEPDIETLIMEDHAFAEVCRTIEKLLRRATEAVKNKVEVDKAGARVLSALTFDNNEDDDDHVGERSFVVDGDGDGGGGGVMDLSEVLSRAEKVKISTSRAGTPLPVIDRVAKATEEGRRVSGGKADSGVDASEPERMDPFERFASGYDSQEVSFVSSEIEGEAEDDDDFSSSSRPPLAARDEPTGPVDGSDDGTDFHLPDLHVTNPTPDSTMHGLYDEMASPLTSEHPDELGSTHPLLGPLSPEELEAEIAQMNEQQREDPALAPVEPNATASSPPAAPPAAEPSTSPSVPPMQTPSTEPPTTPDPASEASSPATVGSNAMGYLGGLFGAWGGQPPPAKDSS